MHLGGLTSILVFTLIFFSVYVFLREQVCTNICPYGRLQGVLLDKNSVVVAYDYQRGEPREKFKKGDQGDAGDCIDCHQCVNVCPTGIDIRNGTQLECINCTACIDACNFIMEKINRPKGLIRYDSENNIAGKIPFTFTPKLKAYTTILIALFIAITALLLTRKNVNGTLMRTSGMLYQEQGADSISNLYNIKLTNKTLKNDTLHVKLENFSGSVRLIGSPVIEIKPEQQVAATFFIVLPKSEIRERKQKIQIGLYNKGGLVNKLSSTFMGPISRSHLK